MNYYDTFVHVAPDCPVQAAVIPRAKGRNKSMPVLEYELLCGQAYFYTQEELLFTVHVQRAGIAPSELKLHHDRLWTEFFAQPRACLRASALPKKYGWGIHFDAQGKAAIYRMESVAYRQFTKNKNITQLLALRSKRA
ncbi:MAG: hypothetical protein FD134_2902 [Gallionellaceae bacterium]|nr:MAG: hypothetical protein FD134_2902 [Gallionellaceae bacterium]